MPTIFQSQQQPASRPSHAGAVREGGRSRSLRSNCRSLSFGGVGRGGRNVTAAGDKLRRLQGRREMLRRALTPPNRRPTLRWLNFRATPSRLSNMSMA
ncbi:hypothetical protein SDJN02_01017, partial [Cucurbita argyrosperma subsp. argyrosperma]